MVRNGLCVPADPCLDVTCGANATCDSGICSCDEGYVEDDDGVCTRRPPAQPDAGQPTQSLPADAGV
jgi:hypothetical protein